MSRVVFVIPPGKLGSKRTKPSWQSTLELIALFVRHFLLFFIPFLLSLCVGRCPSGDNPRTSVDETDCYNKTQSYDGSTTNVGAVYNKCHIDCSNQGICDYSTGYCSCFPGYYGPNCGQTDAARANQYSPDGIYFNLIGEDGEPVPQTFERFNSEDVVDVFAFNNN